MLREIADVKQNPGEPRRRWFSDENFDLIVWEPAGGGVAGFQLCYEKGGDQRAATWFPDSGLCNCAVDNGEDRPGKPKSAPILLCGADDPGGTPPDAGLPPAVLERFRRASRHLDPALVRVVMKHLAPDDPDA
jgi:hypothetical protein